MKVHSSSSITHILCRFNPTLLSFGYFDIYFTTPEAYHWLSLQNLEKAQDPYLELRPTETRATHKRSSL